MYAAMLYLRQTVLIGQSCIRRLPTMGQTTGQVIILNWDVKQPTKHALRGNVLRMYVDISHLFG